MENHLPSAESKLSASRHKRIFFERQPAQSNEDAICCAARSPPRGLRRLNVVFDNWLQWIERSGLKASPMLAANTEFDDRPGPMRDAVVQHMQRLNVEIMRGVQMAMDTGEFATDTDPEQFAFELFGIISSCYRSRNLFDDAKANLRARKAFDRLTSSNMVRQKPGSKVSRRAIK